MKDITPTRQEQRAEAIHRMKLVNLNPEIIREFEETGKLMTCGYPIGTIYETEPGMYGIINALEKKYGFLVYLVVRHEACYGSLINLFFVSKYREEWELENEDMKDGYGIVYCINWTQPVCSEMGSISFKRTKSGGLMRCR